MEIYRPLRKHHRKRTLRIIIVYAALVLIRFSTVSLLGWVYDAHEEYGFFAQTPESSSAFSQFVYSTTRNISSKQKVLVLGILLKNRLGESFSFIAKPPQSGEVLLMKSDYPTKEYSPIKSALFYTLNILTLGIVKHRRAFVFRQVMAVPGDTVVYNGKEVLSVNSISARYLDVHGVPFFDELKEVRLKDDEYFLVGNIEYGMDDRILGPSTLDGYKGKALLMIMPKWGLIHNVQVLPN